MKEITFTRDALRALSRMPANTAKLIMAKIEQYAADPTSLANNVKKLQGRDGSRLRVGDWRVVFDDRGNVMAILKPVRAAGSTNNGGRNERGCQVQGA